MVNITIAIHVKLGAIIETPATLCTCILVIVCMRSIKGGTINKADKYYNG